MSPSLPWQVGAWWVAGAHAPQVGSAGCHQTGGPVRDRRRWMDVVASRSIGTANARGEAQPLGILTSAVVVLGEKVLVDLAREVVSHVGVERADLGRRHAARVRGAVPWRGAL